MGKPKGGSAGTLLSAPTLLVSQLVDRGRIWCNEDGESWFADGHIGTWIFATALTVELRKLGVDESCLPIPAEDVKHVWYRWESFEEFEARFAADFDFDDYEMTIREQYDARLAEGDSEFLFLKTCPADTPSGIPFTRWSRP